MGKGSATLLGIVCHFALVIGYGSDPVPNSVYDQFRSESAKEAQAKEAQKVLDEQLKKVDSILKENEKEQKILNDELKRLEDALRVGNPPGKHNFDLRHWSAGTKKKTQRNQGGNLKFTRIINENLWSAQKRIPLLTTDYENAAKEDKTAGTEKRRIEMYRKEIEKNIFNPAAKTHTQVGFWATAFANPRRLPQVASRLAEGKLDTDYVTALLAHFGEEHALTKLLKSHVQSQMFELLKKRVQMAVPNDFNLCSDKASAELRMDVAVGVVSKQIAPMYRAYVNVQTFGLRGFLMPVPQGLEGTYEAGAQAFAFYTILETVKNRCQQMEDNFGIGGGTAKPPELPSTRRVPPSMGYPRPLHGGGMFWPGRRQRESYGSPGYSPFGGPNSPAQPPPNENDKSSQTHSGLRGRR